jgi:CheY-like chemotaxis protein
MTRVMLVDDHAVVRRGLKAFLHEVPGVEVVEEADDGRAALHQLGVRAATGELPDVALVDLKMPRLAGVELIQAISDHHPSVRVVILTSFGETERVRAALAMLSPGLELDQLEPVFDAGFFTLQPMDLFYPDPWPKRRHWKRRLVNRANLDRFARVLKPGGRFAVSDIPLPDGTVIRGGDPILTTYGAAGHDPARINPRMRSESAGVARSGIESDGPCLKKK